MARSFLCGNFQPTLEAALAQFVASAQARDPLAPVRVVVPSHLLGLHLRRTLARQKPHLAVQFETLDDVALRVTFEQRAREGRRILPRLAFERLIAMIVATAQPDSYFAPVCTMPGFAPRMAATIRDVRDAGIAAADLARVLDSPKARDFADSLATYEERCARARYLDSAGCFALAEQTVEADPEHEVPLVLYGFYDFTGAQWRLVERLIARDSVLMLAPILDGVAGRFGAPLIARLRRLGLARLPMASKVAGEVSAENDLVHVQTRLFADRADGCRGDGSVRFLAPRFRGGEPREVMRCVDERVRAGTELSRIAVLYRRREHALAIEREVRVLERSLGEIEIPVFVQGGIPALAQPASQALLRLVDAIGARYERRATFALFDALGLPRVHALERLAREAGILGRRGLDEWRDKVHGVATALGEAQTGDGEEDTPLRSSLADAESLTREIAALIALDGRLRDATRYAEAAGILVEYLRARLPASEVEVLSEVRDACASLDELELPYDGASLETTLESALRSESDASGGFERGLFLGGILGARGLPFETVILPTLEDGVFPRPTRQDPILLEDERQALHRALLPQDAPGLALASRAAAEERLLFALACRAATKQLVLSCPRREDASEKPVVPSSAWREAIEALLGQSYAGSAPWSEPRLAGLFAVESRQPLEVREFDRAVLQRAIEERSPERARFVADLDPCVMASLRAMRRRGLEKSFTEFDAVLPAADARRLVGDRLREPIAATRLEDYAKCPFVYFASEALGIDPTDPRQEDDELDFRFRGRVLHRALQLHLEEVVASGRVWPPPREQLAAEFAKLSAIGRAELAATASPLGLLPILLAAEALELDDDLRAFLEYEAAESTSFRPRRLESAFGFGRSSGLALATERGHIQFKGMIDRIDFDEARREARVIDYKTGRANPGLRGLAGGRRLQLPVYAFAAKTVLPAGTRVIASDYYYVTRRGGGKRSGFGADDLGDDARVKLALVVGTLATHLEHGVFFADPSDDKICKNCDFSLACGLGAGLEGRFERKREDPAVAALMELRAGLTENDDDTAEEEA